MAAALELVRPIPNIELLWASPREILNIVQAEPSAATSSPSRHDLLKKLSGIGKDLERVLARHRQDVPRRRPAAPATSCEVAC